MIILLKRKYLKFIALFLLAIILGITCLNYTFKATSAPAKIVVVLDAGHGGIDVGVKGVQSDTPEAEINLSITKKVEKKLIDNNFTVVLTREDENGLYGDKTPGFKLRDFKKRKNIIDAANASVLVSIHCNKFPSSDVRGARVFYEPTSESSLHLSKKLQDNLNIINRQEINRDIKEHSGDYYILKCTSVPSAIVECGFLSNPNDDKLLNNEEYQEKIAYAIFSGIVGYLAFN